MDRADRFVNPLTQAELKDSHDLLEELFGEGQRRRIAESTL